MKMPKGTCPLCGRVLNVALVPAHARSCLTPRTLERLLEIAEIPGDCDVDECWPWRGSEADEYGKLVGQAVHRLALELALDRPIAPGKMALHTCDRKPCVNPRHLYEGDHGDNIKDAWTRGRRPNPPPLAAMAEGRRRSERWHRAMKERWVR